MALFQKKNKKPKAKKRDQELTAAGPLLLLFNQYIYWILALFILIVLVASYVLLLAPKFDELRDKSANFIPTRQRVLQDLGTLEIKLQRLESKFNAVQAQRQNELERIASFLPDSPDYPSLFVQSEFISERNNIDLLSIDITRSLERPLSERREPTNQQAALPTEQALEILPQNIRSLVINLSLGNGSYEDFKAYLVDLENNLRLYDVQSLSFGSLDPETGLFSSFAVTLKAYYQLPLNTPNE